MEIYIGVVPKNCTTVVTVLKEGNRNKIYSWSKTVFCSSPYRRYGKKDKFSKYGFVFVNWQQELYSDVYIKNVVIKM